jgi:hypothetical protein
MNGRNAEWPTRTGQHSHDGLRHQARLALVINAARTPWCCMAGSHSIQVLSQNAATDRGPLGSNTLRVARIIFLKDEPPRHPKGRPGCWFLPTGCGG